MTKSTLFWARIGEIIAAIGVIVGIVAGGLFIWSYFHPGSNTSSLGPQPDSFSGNITQASVADNFISFIKGHDAKIVQLDITCTNANAATYASGPNLFGLGPNQPCNDVDPTLYPCGISDTNGIVVQASGDPLVYTLCFYGINPHNVVTRVNGYFSVLISGILGAAPGNAVNIFCKKTTVPTSLHSSQPATFEGDITQQVSASSFVSFLQTHNAATVWLNILCTNPSWPSGSCGGSGSDPGNFCHNPYISLAVRQTGDTTVYEVCIDRHQANVEADNGSYGAGNLVVKGYFSDLMNSTPTGQVYNNVPGVVPVALIGTDSFYAP